MSYVPGSRWLTLEPSGFLREMLKPGPTTAVSVTFGALVADAGSEIAAMESVSASSNRYMETLSRFFIRAECADQFFLRASARTGFLYAGGTPATTNEPRRRLFLSER